MLNSVDHILDEALFVIQSNSGKLDACVFDPVQGRETYTPIWNYNFLDVVKEYYGLPALCITGGTIIAANPKKIRKALIGPQDDQNLKLDFDLGNGTQTAVIFECLGDCAKRLYYTFEMLRLASNNNLKDRRAIMDGSAWTNCAQEIHAACIPLLNTEQRGHLVFPSRAVHAPQMT